MVFFSQMYKNNNGIMKLISIRSWKINICLLVACVLLVLSYHLTVSHKPMKGNTEIIRRPLVHSDEIVLQYIENSSSHKIALETERALNNFGYTGLRIIAIGISTSKNSNER